MIRAPILALALALLGCHNDPIEDTRVDDTGLTEADLDTLTLEVVRTWKDLSATGHAGTTIAVDDGAGQRTEVETDEDGRAVFEVDWSLGPVDITVGADPSMMLGRLVYSLCGVEQTDEIRIPFPDEAAVPNMITVEGTAAPRLDGTYLQVAAYDGYDSFIQTAGDDYAFDVIAGAPFALVGLEYTFDLVDGEFFQDISTWQVVQHDGLDADDDLDIDLGQPVTPIEIQGSFPIPDDPALRAAGGYGKIGIHSGEAWWAQQSGWVTWSNRSSTGDAIDYTAEYVEVPGHEAAMTSLYINGDDGSASGRYQPGLPSSWTEVPELLPLPEFASIPSDLSEEAIVHLAPKPGVSAQRCVWGETTSRTPVWFACAVSSDEVRFPAPPSSMDADHAADIAYVTPYYLDMDGFDFWGDSIRANAWGPAQRLP